MNPKPDSAVSTIVHGARLLSGVVVDILMSDGIIVEIKPSTNLDSQHADTVIDGRGYLALPPLVEPHAHLDKAYLSERIDNLTGDLMGALHGIEAARGSLTYEDTLERAERAAHLLSARGVQLVRSHADTTVDSDLRNIEALLEVKQRCASFIDMQVAALVGWPLSGTHGADNRALARAAIEAGVDVIGGCPHLDDEPADALQFLFELASEYEVPLDLHADENTRPDSSDLEQCADLKISTGSTVSIAASHCVALGMQATDHQHRVAEKVAEADISVISLPLTNLYLQGRDRHSHVPRGLTPVSLLSAHGVNVAAGGDNLQDPFNPLGKGDPLETAGFLVLAGHVLIDEAFHAVTINAQRAIGHQPVDISVGAPANFLLIRAQSLREAVAMQSTERVIIRHGQRLHSRL